MKTNLQTATDIIDECLKDSRVTSAVKMRLAGLIAEKLHEQYKAGMLRAAVICQDTEIPPGVEELSCELGMIDCELAIRAEAEKDELMNILTEAIIAMANDGWLYFGPEGMTKPQEKCYRAYQLVKSADTDPSNETPR